MRKGLKKQAFTLWLLAAVVLAVLFPGPAAKGGILHSEVTTRLGVWIIFLLQGLSLPTRHLLSGFRPVRLHVFILTWNFLWFPVVTGLLMFPLSYWLPESLRLGFWLLAILPTTVASAIAFTALSGGNTAGAIFSTVVSNVLAVFVVPTLALSYLSVETSASPSLQPLFVSLALLIIVPLMVGQSVRAAAPEKMSRFAGKLKFLSSAIILFIVHAAFADSVASGFLAGLTVRSVAAVVVGAVVLLCGVSYLVWASAGLLRMEGSDRITAFYCASQKSLATGLPLMTSVLAVAPDAVDPAAALIPLMCFHPLQLLLAGWASGRFAATVGTPAPSG